MKKYLIVCAILLLPQIAVAEEPIKILTGKDAGQNIKIGKTPELLAMGFRNRKVSSVNKNDDAKVAPWTTGLYVGANGLEMVNKVARALAGEVYVGYKMTDSISYEASLVQPISAGLGKHLPAGTLSFLGKVPLSRDVNATLRVGGIADGTWGDFYGGAGVIARVTKRIDLRFEARTRGILPSATAVAGITYNF